MAPGLCQGRNAATQLGGAQLSDAQCGHMLHPRAGCCTMQGLRCKLGMVWRIQVCGGGGSRKPNRQTTTPAARWAEPPIDELRRLPPTDAQERLSRQLPWSIGALVLVSHPERRGRGFWRRCCDHPRGPMGHPPQTAQAIERDAVGDKPPDQSGLARERQLDADTVPCLHLPVLAGLPPTCGRFIQDDDPGVPQKRHRHAQPPPHAPAVRRGLHVGGRRQSHLQYHQGGFATPSPTPCSHTA